MEGYRRRKISNFEQPPRKTSGVFGFFAKSAIFLAAASAVAYWHVSSYGETPVKNMAFSITKGESASSLPKKLKLEAWLRSRLYMKYFAPEINVQVGTYRIDSKTPMTFERVFTEVLPNPQTKDVTVTFLPGWTLYDIDAYLADMGMIEKGQVSAIASDDLEYLKSAYPFLKWRDSLEWFVYPDTYQVRPAASVTSILSRALTNFDKKVYSKHKDLGASFYDTLILASIVEKEERVVTNKAKVAWALQRRLDGKCADTWKIIGADATVCYPYGITSKECTPSFIVEHLYEETPYNTRRVAGLPPTPIANPTDDSFIAARNPEWTACYYLHDPKGQIHFANDAPGHERNKNLYLR